MKKNCALDNADGVPTEVVLLHVTGDYCDRGPHTAKVLDWLIDLQVII